MGQSDQGCQYPRKLVAGAHTGRQTADVENLRGQQTMSSAELSVYAVGDVGPTWISPEPLFAPSTPTLRQADILFGNMEVPVCEAHEIQLFNYSGRRMSPNRVAELTTAGF